MSDDNVIRLPKPLNRTYYVVSWRRDETPRPCIVCAGKRVLRVELGDGEIVTPPCDGCQRGHLGNDGLEPFSFHAGPWDFRVDTFVPTWASTSGGDFLYSAAGGACFRVEGMHETEDAAKAEASRRYDEMMAQRARDAKRRRKKDGEARTVDMLAYHVQQRAKLRAELARYDEWLHSKGVEKEVSR